MHAPKNEKKLILEIFEAFRKITTKNIFGYMKNWFKFIKKAYFKEIFAE